MIKDKMINLKLISVWMVIFLIVNTSFVSALEISNVRTESITQNSAVVKWDTDEPVDSFVEYGTDKTNLRRIGDSNLVREHQIFVSALNQETTYLFSVESNAQEDNNNGNYHSFQTLPPDTVAPALLVSLPEMVQGNKADISGKTEAGVKIKLFLNGNLVRNTEASAWGADGSDVTYSDAIYTGFFNFTAVVLPENVLTTVKVEAEDLFGNKANFDGVIFADSKAPVLSLAEIPAIVAERTIKLNGTVSENSSLEVFVNEKSRKKWEGNIIAQDINLDEGENKIKIVARDPADWETVIEMMVHSDTLPPKVSFELVSGTEYYEGRAETDISGESKAGAKLYLYIFREGESRRKADFGKAVDSVEADAEGKFVFKEVSFPPPPFTSWKDLAPKEVPSGLEDILISPVGQVEQQQRKTYRVFIVAEDNLGRNSFAERKVNINTCFSSQTFDLVPLPQFQAPFRLDPGLMEEGRESIQAVFNLSYRGSALASTDKTGQAVEPYRITQVQFTKACTQDTADSDDYAFGCKLLPGNLKAVPNNARNPSAYFVTADLGSAADFLDKEEDAWGDFKKRQLKFPIKIMIHYNERDATGGFSAAKTDVMCYDLAYFVDVPIESEDMVPDFLVDQGIPALNTTINAIETIKPYLRTAMMVTGISCVGSFLTKMVVRFYRIFISNFEPWKPSGGEESCPSVLEQNKGLYLQSTIDDWDDLKGSGHPDLGNDRNKIPDVMESLDEKCPQTALAWTMEETLDKFYRWTCDRFFCRAVPAGWTADREVAEIETVIQEQKQCTATANCATLEKIENCREFMKRNPTNSEILVEVGDSVGTCYRDSEGYIYYKDPRIQVPELEDRGISKLTGLMKIGEVGRITKPPLLAYQESGSDSFCVAPDISCESMCKRVGGYQAVNDGYRVDLTTGDVEGGSGGTGGDAELGGVTSGLRISPPSTPITGSSEENLGRIIIEETEASALALTPSGELETGRAISIFKNNLFGLALTAPKNSCYKQVSAESNIISFAQGQDMKLVDGSGNQISGKTKIPAGYTKDCFVDAEGARYQCVCDTTQKAALTKLGGTAREAVKKTDNAEEKWDYRQATIFRESNGFSGVYYPKERYYSGRDLSGAFGLSFGLDNFAPKGEEKVAEVNPHTQTFGAFQSLCLPGINARLELLQSILVGLRNCIVEAKYTGLHDAGMCKTIFSQYVCGLVYKGITLLTSSCSPISLKDMDNTGVELEGVEAFTKSAFAAVPQAMDSSIDEVRSDYANSNVEQFFASGVQGFSESLCMAAFGYDFPMGMDFIMDSAYSFPMKTSVIFPIASRELSTFDPVKGTATFNYNLAGTILPGCNLRGYKISLKCIGPEDLGQPNVQCGDEGCDCIQTSQQDSVFGAEKVFNGLQGGTSFGGVTRHQMFDLPLPSPQKVSSNFRYDHVVVELFLDQGEKPDACFDEGYRTANGGKFYFPITAIQVPAGVNCYVHGASGRFICPDIGKMFGGGNTYFENPYLRCYDKDADDYVKCDSTNLFVQNRGDGRGSDDIVIKPYINMAGQGVCLRVTDTRRNIVLHESPIPEGINGPLSPSINLGPITPEMIAGSGAPTISPKDKCGDKPNQVEIVSSPLTISGKTYSDFTFSYKKVADKFELTFPGGPHGINVVPPSTAYSAVPVTGSSGVASGMYQLQRSGETSFTLDEINDVVFNYGEFTFKNILGSLVSATPEGTCTYTVFHGVKGSVSGSTSLPIKLELFQSPDGGASCLKASTLMPKGALGEPVHTDKILIQAQPVELEEYADMHSNFMAGRYKKVMDIAFGIVSAKRNDFPHVLGLYYWIASLIMQNDASKGIDNSAQIKGLLGLFFNRIYTDGVELLDYPEDVKSRQEFQKISTYLCCVAGKYAAGEVYSECSGVVCN